MRKETSNENEWSNYNKVLTNSQENKTFHQLVNGTCTNVNSKQISKIVDIHSAKYVIKMYASV